jgi:hypothetical protein
MLLDIGAKTSNLLFFEKGKVYSRSINLGANSITQDFANESKLPFADAEKKKISEGFVSLGGAYEEPENAHQAAISKIARQFMTRLHIQVNQTMQFYRGQQGGSAPQRLFLSGGASLMPYTAQFFAEKLNVPVEYFNPFRNVEIDPSVNLEDLARVAHSLGEVVGLGLRNLAHCPVELNLMPESTLSWVTFNQKKPYFIFTAFSLVLVVFAFGFIYKELANINRQELATLTAEIQPLRDRQALFKKANGDLTASKADAAQYISWIDGRYHWAEVFTELHVILIQVEAETGAKLRMPTGIWIEKFVSDHDMEENALGTMAGIGMPQIPVEFTAPRNRMPGMSANGTREMPGEAPPPPVPLTDAAPPGVTPKTNTVSEITMICRGVDLATASGVPAANSDIAFTLERALQNSPLFDKDGTQLAGDNNADPNGTFTFGVKLKLKHPLKLSDR